MEFKKYKISDIAEVIGGGTPSTKKTEYYGDDIAWITPKDLSNFHTRYISKGERSLTTLGLQRSSARLMPANTVLFTSRAPIGYVAISKNNISTNQGFKSLICRQDKILPEYMYYLMKFNTPALENQATGSTFKEVSGTIVKNFEVLIPDINEQKEIIGILGSLDSKIELNLDLISTLEEISKILFKHWFVDFEFPNEEGKPYKSSGGDMIESELGDIPKNWVVNGLSNIAEIVMGQSPKSDTYNNEKIGLPLLNGATDFRNRMLSPSKYTSDAKKIGHQGDYVFGVRATLGLVTELDDTYAIGRGSGIAKALYPEQKEYLYEILNKAFDEFQYTASGSVYLNISKNDLMYFKICQPPFDIFKKYHLLVNTIIIQKENLKRQNKNLIQLRDTLLPKLLSGEIEISEELEV